MVAAGGGGLQWGWCYDDFTHINIVHAFIIIYIFLKKDKYLFLNNIEYDKWVIKFISMLFETLKWSNKNSLENPSKMVIGDGMRWMKGNIIVQPIWSRLSKIKRTINGHPILPAPSTLTVLDTITRVTPVKNNDTNGFISFIMVCDHAHT